MLPVLPSVPLQRDIRLRVLLALKSLRALASEKGKKERKKKRTTRGYSARPSFDTYVSPRTMRVVAIARGIKHGRHESPSAARRSRLGSFATPLYRIPMESGTAVSKIAPNYTLGEKCARNDV